MSSLKQVPAGGKPYWRSLEELAGDPEFERFVRNEFPATADEMLAPGSRRTFLKLMGASVALAGMTSCRWPVEEILPFASRPEGYVPGEPMRFATAMELDGAGTGLLVTSYDGRPVKIEGNPEHPGSLGGSSAWAQAAILELYDPDRSSAVLRRGDDGGDARSDWSAFDEFARGHFGELARKQGRGLAVLAGSSASPTLAALRARMQTRFLGMHWHEWEPASRDNAREGARMAFGRPLRADFDLANADVIVSLDEDLLLRHPAAVRYARDFAAGRRGEQGTLSRLYAVESAYSTTGVMADERIPLPTRIIPTIAACLAAELILDRGLPLPAGAAELRQLLSFFEGHPLRRARDWTLARDLLANRGRGVIAVGPRQPPEIHALGHLLNVALGNAGRTVRYTAEPDAERPTHARSIAALSASIARGEVETLLILGRNPVFDAPADLDFAGKLDRVTTTIHHGLYRDETARACRWHLPQAHFLESWGDTRAWDGTYGVTQPLIEPLAGGRSAIELLASLLGEPARGHDVVRDGFRAVVAAGDPERAWRRTLHDGLLAGSAAPAASAALRPVGWTTELALHLHTRSTLPGADEVELTFLPDAKLHDGRFANSGWLQELPDPLTKLTWDNAFHVGPATARELGLRQEDLVRVTAGERSIELPVYIVPGQAPGTASVSFGYGRRHGGQVAPGVGVDVFPLRSGDALDWTIARVARTGRKYELATTQNHWAIDTMGAEETERRARVHAREVTLAEFLADPKAVAHAGPKFHHVELWRDPEYDGHKWGMAIDLTACTGCNACILACQSENNIPVVGKAEVKMGREMHWIRVDRYWKGDPEDPAVAVQPLTCQHCETAPCEQVCPVAATVHDSEGLNVMVYNRCIGTRYCANNCPYKVRRFNWFNNHKHESALTGMMYNPEVTVRARGVMEKCSFCLQRINRVKIRAKNDRRPVADGEIVPACAQACPTRAIRFGDLNDPASDVSVHHADARAYSVLEEMNTRPRTRYLARLKNPPGAAAAGHGTDDEGAA